MAEKITPEVHAAYERIHSTPEFAELRRRYLKFVVPMTVTFMLWYLLYVVCSNWAPGLMGAKVFGNINIALLFGLLQFATTFGIAWWYARYSAREMDPIASELLVSFDKEVGQ